MKKNRFQRFLFLAFPCQFLFSVCAAVIGELIAIQRHGRVGPSVATPEGGWGWCSVTMSRPHPATAWVSHITLSRSSWGETRAWEPEHLPPHTSTLPGARLPPRHHRGQQGLPLPAQEVGAASAYQHLCFGIIYFEGEMRTK